MMPSGNVQNTIFIGQNETSKYLAFGDDSRYNDILVYAFATLERAVLFEAEKMVSELKETYKIPMSVPLHCRILFNSKAREKHGLGHISIGDVQKVIRRTVKIVNQIPIGLRYTYCKFSEGVDSFGRFNNTLPMINKYDGSTMSITANPDPKGFQAMLRDSCFLPATGWPLATEYEIIISHDKTKVKFVGDQKQQAHHLMQSYSAVGAPTGALYKFKPKIVDILSYLCSHSIVPHNNEPNLSFLQNQFREIKRFTVGKCYFDNA